ncbi:uncharacterized protein LOC142985291 [Anticarsia gemmatalis]|uniref:uncharacterized protein LOC142985291 n=1 Tax=Anticarsia gemmatalis TaxID=129554 RepID=UPI003F765A12
MALFMKQDFSPPILSRRWVAMKFRPNMVIYSRKHIISILESGLLFREDSLEVEQEAPSPDEVRIAAGGKGWMTTGEKVAAVVGVAACVMAFPPRHIHRSLLLNISAYASIPLAVRWAHRSQCAGSLTSLLTVMREYLALARRTAACLKEYAALYAQLGSLTSVIDSTRLLLCRQQSALSVLLSRASSAVLGNAPWLHADIDWQAVARQPDDNLMKIHHAYLVVQSTLLKHLAKAHYIPPAAAQRVYKNYNERLYWIHNTVIPHLTEEFKQNLESLERMYRLLKNSANVNTEVKKLGTAVNDSWVYSDVHTGVAKTCLEIKLTANKCNSLDVFLDSCAMNKQNIDLEVLNKDIDDIIDGLTKCLKSIQNSQLRLKKLQNKCEKEVTVENVEVTENAGILTLTDDLPESKDEVFYFVKTDDDDSVVPVGDLTTAPGKKERETSKIVFCELKRKLGKREDVMRERERQALAKTMPELKDIPEFPRQISLDDYIERKGFIKKINKKSTKKHKLSVKTKRIRIKNKKFRLKIAKYGNESDISGDVFEANAKLNVKSKLLTVNSGSKYYITRWCKQIVSEKSSYKDFESISEDLSDIEPSSSNKLNGNNDIKFSKADLELSNSSSESDFEMYKEKQMALLNDVRRHRAVRKKNYPNHRPVIDNVDESLKPIEYTFGTGMAMASVLQLSRKINSAQEEVFIGDGELSSDSGNDEDS